MFVLFFQIIFKCYLYFTGAVWTDKAIMALLSLYEANVHMLDHPKKKTKIWTAVSDGLKDFEIEV